MTSLQAVQTLTEGWAEPLVGLNGVDEKSVAASLGLLQHVQKGCAGRLALVRDVTVPGHGARAVGKVLVNGIVAGAAVNQVNLREALGGARGWVDMVAVLSVRDQFVRFSRATMGTYRPKYEPNSRSCSMGKSTKS